MPSITVDDSDFNQALGRYLREYPREVSESLRIRARLLFTRIVKTLPPKSKSQGLKRVRADITKAMSPLDPMSFTHPAVRATIRRGDLEATRRIVQNSKSPALAGRRVEKFSSAWHIIARESGTGRVRASKKILVLGFPEWKKYVKARQKRVGLLRASFAKPALELGGSLPMWATSGLEAQSATVHDESATKFRYTFISNLAYSGRFQRQVNFALSIETKNMIKDLERALRRAQQRAKL